MTLPRRVTSTIRNSIGLGRHSETNLADNSIGLGQQNREFPTARSEELAPRPMPPSGRKAPRRSSLQSRRISLNQMLDSDNDSASVSQISLISGDSSRDAPPMPPKRRNAPRRPSLQMRRFSVRSLLNSDDDSTSASHVSAASGESSRIGKAGKKTGGKRTSRRSTIGFGRRSSSRTESDDDTVSCTNFEVGSHSEHSGMYEQRKAGDLPGVTILVNQARRGCCLASLKRSFELDEVCRSNAEAMACSGSLVQTELSKLRELLGSGTVAEFVQNGHSIRDLQRAATCEKGANWVNVCNPLYTEFGLATAMAEDGKLFMCCVFR